MNRWLRYAVAIVAGGVGGALGLHLAGERSVGAGIGVLSTLAANLLIREGRWFVDGERFPDRASFVVAFLTGHTLFTTRYGGDTAAGALFLILLMIIFLLTGVAVDPGRSSPEDETGS